MSSRSELDLYRKTPHGLLWWHSGGTGGGGFSIHVTGGMPFLAPLPFIFLTPKRSLKFLWSPSQHLYGAWCWVWKKSRYPQSPRLSPLYAVV